MSSENVICPVCTLYLRPGITLKGHLSSHPKQKVIEALVRVANNESTKQKELTIAQVEESSEENNGANSNQFVEDASVQNTSNSNPSQNFNVIPGNHSFIYHQFMSTSSQQSAPAMLAGNPLAPQYITIPTVFSPQMVCTPYMYQQQQVIMSSGHSLPPLLPKPPVDIPASTQSSIAPQPPVIVSSGQNFQDRPNFVVVERCVSSDSTNNRPSSRLSSRSLIVSPVPHSPSVHSSVSQGSMSPVFSPEPLMEDTKDEDESNYKKEEVGVNDGQDVFDNKRNENDAEVESEFQKSQVIKMDVSKACQTQQVDQNNVTEGVAYYQDEIAGASRQNEDNASSNYYGSESVITSDHVRVTIANEYEAGEPIFSMSNIFGGSDQEQTNMDNINIILSPGFSNSQFISRVEDFENINSQDDKRIIMNIGCIESNNQKSVERLGDESMSHESENVSIRADEPMPARGELSGQESNGGASDTVWGRLQYESSSRISASFDLMQEPWEVSENSYNEVPPLQSRNVANMQYEGDENEDSPTVVSVIAAPKNFKCSVCGEAFNCLKDRRVHHKEKHATESEKGTKNKGVNIIGSKIGGKKVKKLVIKPKKNENNFNNVFTNKIKTQADQEQNQDDRESVIMPSSVKDELRDEKKVGSNEVLSCSLCEQVFLNLKQLRSHTLLEHNINISYDWRRRCSVCNEGFTKESDYNLHLQIHPLECRLCGKYFFKRANMQLHLKRHMGIRPYKCELCNKSFLTKQKYNEHKNVHTGETPIKCNMCDETFKRHSNLVQHRNRHHLNVKPKVKDYICFCGEVVHSKKKLAWHKEIHESKPKACLYCSEKFIHTASLTRHIRRTHNQDYVPDKDRSSENVECPICKGIYLRSSLDAHIRSHSGEKPYSCQVCSKDFTTKWNLKLHKWTHASRSAKPYKCELCKGAFIRESEYVAHMNSHKSVRPYTCNHCGAQFIRKYNCQRHVREHLAGKSFSCNICGKMFHRSYYLKDHMRVHNGTRPFACHVCGKTSTTKSNHNKHIRIHHAREPVSTEN